MATTANTQGAANSASAAAAAEILNSEYSYEIVEVNEANRTMLVKYLIPGRDPILVGAMLPFADESLANVVHTYNPLAQIAMKERPVKSVVAGMKGTSSEATNKPPTPEQVAAMAAEAAEAAAIVAAATAAAEEARVKSLIQRVLVEMSEATV